MYIYKTHHEGRAKDDFEDRQLAVLAQNVVHARRTERVEIVRPGLARVLQSFDLIGERALPRLQHLGGLLLGPVDVVDLVGVGPEIVDLALAHQLDDGLEGGGTGQVAGLVVLGAAHHQLLRPVHVLGGEAVAAARQLSTDVRYLCACETRVIIVIIGGGRVV